jgi:putative transposase
MKYVRQHSRDRESIRLKGYDYRFSGAYFVTLVSWQRECSFGEVNEGRIRLNLIGNIIDSEWRKLGYHFPNIRADAFVIMPNHVHGIIVIHSPEIRAGTVETQHAASLRNELGDHSLVHRERLGSNGITTNV